MSDVTRRQALKFLGGVVSVAVLEHLSGEELFALGREAHARLSETADGLYVFQTLDAHQNATVKVLIDRILPQTDTPGALAVRVNEFIDLMLTDVLKAEERDRLLKGLVRLDRESQAAFGGDFIACEAGQQVELLRAQEKEALAVAASAPVTLSWGRPKPPREHFFHLAKWLTLFGYYTSEAGLVGELGMVMIPGSYSGCPRP